MMKAVDIRQLVMFMFCITACSCDTSNKEELLRTCKKFLDTNPESYPVQITLTNDGGYMGYFRKPVGKYLLDNFIKLNKTEAVIDGPEMTSVCVSVVDTTSHTYFLNNTNEKIGWVTFNTKVEVLTGIVNFSTPCWKNSKECIAIFIPVPGFMDTALFNYSPFNEEFWNYVQDDTVFQKDWIWRMNFKSTRASGSINTSWVSRMNLSSLVELQFLGNDWKRPETLMGSLANLGKLDLSYNNIEIMPNDTIDRLPQLYYLLLGHNNISKLPYGVEKLKRIHIVDLTNPLGNATLSMSDDDISTLNRVVVLGLERTKLEANVTNIISLPNLKFLNLSGCFIGNIDDESTDNLMQNSQLEQIDFSFNNIDEIPMRVFSKTKKLLRLHLHHNKLKSCSNDSLNNLVELKYLDMSWNKLDSIHQDCLFKLHKLEELDFSWNKISSLHISMFRNATKLKRLILSHNSLSFIYPKVLLPLKDLTFLDLSFNHLLKEPIIGENTLDNVLLANNRITEIYNMTYFTKHIDNLDLSGNLIRKVQFHNVNTLNLSYNSLTHISKEMWEYLDNLTTVDLGHNQFDCCHNDTPFLQQKLRSPNHIRYLGRNESRSFTCFINHQEVQLEKFEYNTSLCLEESMADPTNLYIEVGVAVLFLFSLVIVTMALLYFYRTELTYISHLFKMKKRGWEKDEERYNACTYDAFVCYSGNNLKWIVEELLPNLEKGPEGYRLCLHDRDFTLGAAIDTNVIASLEKSRKVVFVLSQNFISSRWCQWELEMANHKMFEENLSYIILIELERLDKKNIPRHLRYLMDTRTYLEWPQDSTDEQKIQRCWNRLRHALGDSIFKRTGKCAPKCSVLDL
ncbi:toll-like receptor 13 [Anabrus simplex]|uniref:toll-like receptor 13 n=1 Tax=Anabrus simplex TaxID=316456 RepID=UPI0035A38300